MAPNSSLFTGDSNTIMEQERDGEKLDQHQKPDEPVFASRNGLVDGASKFQNFGGTSAPGQPTDFSTGDIGGLASTIQTLLLNNANDNPTANGTNNPDSNNTNDNTAQQLLAAQQLLQQQQTAALLAAVAGGSTDNNIQSLISQNLQASALAPSQQQLSLNETSAALIPMLANALGTASHVNQPVLRNPIPAPPAMTVQDRPNVTPVYNGVNPNYPGLRVVNSDPPVFCVDNFLTPWECQFLVSVASDSFGPAPVVGKGAGEVSPSRTSSTCYLAREDLPDYLRKVSLLTGKPIEHCELPQVGRYLPSQQYLQHFDAFDTSNEDGQRFAANGGQRTITVLVYLNDVERGGATRFPALNLDVQPRQGMALVFFPATVDGYLDKMALHAAMPAVDPKFVSQVWIRQGSYNGQPSKRLSQTMGTPFNPPIGSASVPQPLGHAQQVMSNTNTALSNPLQQLQLGQQQQQGYQQQYQQEHQYHQQALPRNF